MKSDRGWALVTGGNRGIGAAICVRLAKDGWPILLNHRSDAGDVADKIRESGGVVRSLQFDIRDAEEVSKQLTPILDEVFVGCVVNNAGVARDAAFPGMKREDWELVTRTTLDGFFNVTQPLVMPMVRKRFGRIINISSISGVAGNRGQTNYAAAKGGLIAATKSLALELAKRKITVNAVAPGLIETDMISEMPVDKIKEQIPLRRLGKAEEVAGLVSFLASDKSAYITGQVLGINGGMI